MSLLWFSFGPCLLSSVWASLGFRFTFFFCKGRVEAIGRDKVGGEGVLGYDAVYIDT